MTEVLKIPMMQTLVLFGLIALFNVHLPCLLKELDFDTVHTRHSGVVYIKEDNFYTAQTESLLYMFISRHVLMLEHQYCSNHSRRHYNGKALRGRTITHPKYWMDSFFAHYGAWEIDSSKSDCQRQINIKAIKYVVVLLRDFVKKDYLLVLKLKLIILGDS